MRLSAGEGGTSEAWARGGRVVVAKRSPNAYDAQMQTPTFQLALKKGEVVYVTYEARGPQSRHESGTAFWTAFFQRATPPWDGFGSGAGSAGKSWRTFHHTALVDKDYPARSVEMTMHVAGAEQTIEVRNLRGYVFPVGSDLAKFPFTMLTYAGREANAPWRAKAKGMIERNRKADLQITVERGGKPAAGVPVRVRMLRHAYPFGTFAEYHVPKQEPDSVRYRKLLESNWFSRVTVPVYWSDWGWEFEPNRKDYLATIAWGRKNGIRMKAHCLLWPSDRWLPERIRPLRGEALRTALTQSIDERLPMLKGPGIENLDVVNELKTEHEVVDRVGLDPIVEYFKKTRAAFPKADLVYNDYATFEGEGGGGEPFRVALDWTKRLKAAGAPITLSGWQAHFGEDLTPPEKVWALIDRWHKETGLPLEITEFDVNTRDEVAQADYLRDLLTCWFAHPQTRGFTIWGFWEKTHWIPAGAMFRTDWSRKPAADVWERLVTKEWWTDVTVRTDARGVAKVRGFLGDYAVSVEGAELRFPLGKEGAKPRIRIKI